MPPAAKVKMQDVLKMKVGGQATEHVRWTQERQRAEKILKVDIKKELAQSKDLGKEIDKLATVCRGGAEFLKKNKDLKSDPSLVKTVEDMRSALEKVVNDYRKAIKPRLAQAKKEKNKPAFDAWEDLDTWLESLGNGLGNMTRPITSRQ